MNRIDKLFASGRGLLSVYFTAGFPAADDTLPVLTALQDAGADFVEIGMPFSDPLADGPVIQQASLEALRGGMSVERLLGQLGAMRPGVAIPVVLMGYVNPVLRYGMERFLDRCRAVGVDGVILPDLPWEEYRANYRHLFDARGIRFIPLIAPQTPDARVREIDAEAEGFIYMVASAGVTGNVRHDAEARSRYFERVAALGLRNHRMIGFGVKDAEGFRQACAHADGAIVGTAFVSHLREHGLSAEGVARFVRSIRGAD